MPKYIFTQGQVFVDETAFSPLTRKPKDATDSVVLLIVQPAFFNQQIAQENDSHD